MRYWPPSKQTILSICFAVFFLIFFGLYLGFIPTQGSICYQIDQLNGEKCRVFNIFLVLVWDIGEFFNHFGPAITALAGVAVAGFTWQLKRSTDKLWRSGDSQLNLIAQSTKAAVIQADAAVNADRPFVYVSDIKLIPVSSSKNADELDAITVYKPCYTFTNYGRTPAFVTEIGYGYCVGAEPPKIPMYVPINDITSLVIRPNESFFFEENLTVLAVWPEQKTDFESGQVVAWFWGKIRFKDVFGGVSENGFIALRYPEKKTGDRLLRKEEFLFRGPKAYTYQTYIQNHENKEADANAAYPYPLG